ncbi:acetyltransferase [Embleya sp. NBC_00896]|uniref:acetyltransferase n=1 Tax=Embleya sp. NBC_00896 TaxID=2975961 RepID=UPI00386ACAC8|nr:acetyltransferase [Embleya sp. NBC_00896]
MAFRDLLIVGAGGFARETAAAIHDFRAPRGSSGWRLLGFLDDDPARQGTEVDGVPVLGDAEAVHKWPDALVVVCTGSPTNRWSRTRIVTRLGLPDTRWATLVHVSAVLPRTCEVGPGSVLMAQTVLTTAVRVGAHAHTMPHVVLTHDDDVGAFATLAAGVRLAGGVTVGRGAYLGAGAMVREHRGVGAWSLVGMGSVVTRDVPPAEVWAGVPARRLRSAPVPADVDVRRRGGDVDEC